MIAPKGKPDIGDKINTQIIQPLIEASDRLGRSDFPDFNDPVITSLILDRFNG